MILKQTLVGGLALSALAAPAFADHTDFSFPVHDIIITSNIPTVNFAVRNMSSSTDPEDRDLRVVSQTPVIPVSGQVWCKQYQNAEAGALRAQILFGNAIVMAGENGSDVYPLGTFSGSNVNSFNGTHNLENFQIEAAFDVPTTYDRHALVDLTPFNPVRTVEHHLEQFVENGAGSEADFLRVDDVFQVQVRLNAVGWCSYNSANTSGEYAGLRGVPMTVTIFYHGDPDIQDIIGTVGGANTVAAPVPNRAREVTRTRGTDTAPPGRTSRPARADDDNRAARGGIRVSAGDINSDGHRKPATLAGKQAQLGTGRTQGRAEVGSAQAAANDPLRDGTDTDSDGAQAGLILPAVQRVRAADDPSGAAAGDERNSPPVQAVDADQDQAAPVDALHVINELADDGVEPEEID